MELIIAANWKMNKTVTEAAAICRRLIEAGDRLAGVETLICPPFTALAAVQQELSGSPLKLGAQNMHWCKQGAFTGEISPSMLLELGVSHVIIGHSERRHIMGEDDRTVNKKMLAALEYGLIPVLCVGETEQERQEGATEQVIRRQVGLALQGINLEAINRLVIAYEPVWAIGTGVAASSGDAGSAGQLIREVTVETLGQEVLGRLQVQYGGSVNENNIFEFVSLPSINGALVGGASLNPDSFISLIEAAREAVC
ncbi:MAG TPA: triose-phosphate isomerase [Firmicutes bacterium]|nr:triose-phosphate isomerase [Bacillota bacterium]